MINPFSRELPEEVKKYLKTVQRKLNLPKEIRAKVISDLVTGICSRKENGESYEEILRSMGTAEEVAAGLNEEMKDMTYQKNKWRWLCLPVGLVSLAVILERGITGLLTHFANLTVDSLGVIGGADGPTAIFVTASPGTDARSLVIAGILLIMSILAFYKLSHQKNKQKKFELSG